MAAWMNIKKFLHCHFTKALPCYHFCIFIFYTQYLIFCSTLFLLYFFRNITVMAFSDDCFEWGTLNLMMGSIKIQFTPVLSDEIPQLGRNGACMDEIERMMLGLPEADLKRTVRTILRLVLFCLFSISLLKIFLLTESLEKGESNLRNTGSILKPKKMNWVKIFLSWTSVRQRRIS